MITVEVYSSGMTLIGDPRRDLQRIRRLQYETQYPGGLYGAARMTIPRRLADWWQLNGAQRLVIRSGLAIVYEGWIDNLAAALEQTGDELEVVAIGSWGYHMMRRLIAKPWADDRITPQAWYEGHVPGSGLLDFNRDRYRTDRENRIRIVATGAAVAANDGRSLSYSAPVGETIKRITLNYSMQEGAYAFTLRLYNHASGSNIWAVTASGSGSRDDTLATPTRHVFVQFYSNAAQTPPGGGEIYGEISNVMIYTETGSINLTEIARDVVDRLSGALNSTYMYIGANTLALAPFYTDGYETAADILRRAAEHGDASGNAWAAYVDHSERAPTPDGRGVLVVEQQPALTGCDYEISLDEARRGGGRFEWAFDSLANWIIVGYYAYAGRDRRVWITPDDDSSLMDASSIARWGRRDHVLTLDTTDSAAAAAYGVRYLKAHAQPILRMTAPLQLTGMVRRSGGGYDPVSLIRAGRRMRIRDYVQTLSGEGATFLITRTLYDRETNTAQVGGGDIALI